MAKVLQRLVRQDLLASHHGTRGGYHLSRPCALDLGGGRHRRRRPPAPVAVGRHMYGFGGVLPRSRA